MTPARIIAIVLFILAAVVAFWAAAPISWAVLVCLGLAALAYDGAAVR